MFDPNRLDAITYGMSRTRYHNHVRVYNHIFSALKRFFIDIFVVTIVVYLAWGEISCVVAAQGTESIVLSPPSLPVDYR